MVHLREFQWKDYDGIMSLCQSNSLSLYSFDNWKKLWVNNPSYTNVADTWPMGWILETDNKEIVGHFANIPMDYELEGKRILVAAGHLWVVDPAYRSLSLQLPRSYFSQKGIDLYLMTSVSGQAGKVYRAFDSKEVPFHDYDESLYWITNPVDFGSVVFKKKEWISPYLIGRSVGFALNIYNFLSRLRKNSVQFDINYSISEAAYFDDRFDSFWKKIRLERKRLFYVREKKYLSWHYDFSSDRPGWINILEQDGHLMGYAIFIHQDNPKIGLRRVKLADIQLLDDNPRNYLCLFSEALKRCEEMGIHLMEVEGFNERKRNILKALSPWKRKISHISYFFKSPDPRISQLLDNSEYWDLSIIDGDASL